MPAKYIVIDTETTGLNPFRHALVQLGFLFLDEKLEVIESGCVDILPITEYECDPIATKITGFTIERIQKGMDQKKTLTDFYDLVSGYFPLVEDEDGKFEKSKIVWVGQFFPFDYAVMQKAFSDADMIEQFGHIFGNSFIDTKSDVLAQNLKAELKGNTIPYPVTSLSAPGGLKEVFGITEFQAHDALGDCHATRLVLKGLLEG